MSVSSVVEEGVNRWIVPAVGIEESLLRDFWLIPDLEHESPGVSPVWLGTMPQGLVDEGNPPPFTS